MPLLPIENLKNPRAVARFAGTCVIGLTLDLWTKWWSFNALAHDVYTDPEGRVRVVTGEYQFIPGWLHFEVTANQGAVFGLGQGQVKFFVAVSVFAIFLLTWLFATSGRKWFPQVVLGMLLAGVLGNMYDRISVGYVRDMIHMMPGKLNPLRGWFPSWHYIFPWIFNVADVMLCVGVGLTLVLGLFHKKDEQSSPSEQDEAPPRVKSSV
jgi:signal peptidase II